MEINGKVKAHFLNLYAMALSDLNVHPKELAFLYELGESRGISKADIDEIIMRPDKVVFIPPDDVLEKIEYLYDFALMIWADGQVLDDERASLERFAQKFGFLEENIKELCDLLLEKAGVNMPKDEFIQFVKENI